MVQFMNETQKLKFNVYNLLTLSFLKINLLITDPTTIQEDSTTPF